MVKHRGKFKWKKYSKYSGNLKDYWTHPDRGHERHRMIEGSIVAAIQRYHPEWEPPADNGYEWVSCLCPFMGTPTGQRQCLSPGTLSIVSLVQRKVTLSG
jgi:hypothetical protein